MTEKEEIISKIEKIKSHLANNFGVSKLGIFGSIARGDENTSSDIDVIVEFDPAHPADFFVLSALAETLKQLVGRDVDIITKNSIAKKHRLKSRIEKETVYV